MLYGMIVPTIQDSSSTETMLFIYGHVFMTHRSFGGNALDMHTAGQHPSGLRHAIWIAANGCGADVLSWMK
jgi:hypothetical protein